jgi:hypothetical protein
MLHSGRSPGQEASNCLLVKPDNIDGRAVGEQPTATDDERNLMSGIVDLVHQHESPGERQTKIVDVLVDAFSELMDAAPDAFRQKFRKMAADPFAFYRGSACLFYADMEGKEDRWADDRTSRVWIQGDLHAENFGTYMAGDGVFVFDVNDFDEAYLGHFTWDIERMVASVALLGWMKAISDADIARLIEMYVRAYRQPVREQSPATSGDVEIEAVQVLDEKGRPVNTVPSGSTLTVRVHLRYTRTVEDSTLGITLRRKRAGMNLFSTDTDGEGTTLGPRERGERAMVDFTFEVPLQPGNYTVSAVVFTPETEDSYATLADSAAAFKITRSGRPVRGLVRLPTKVEIGDPEREVPGRSA